MAIDNETNLADNSTNNGTVRPNSRSCFVIGYPNPFDCLESALNGEDSCLAGDSLAQLATGGNKKVSDLQAGDRVLAMDPNDPHQIIETDVIMIMHCASTEYGLYQSIKYVMKFDKDVTRPSDPLCSVDRSESLL